MSGEAGMNETEIKSTPIYAEMRRRLAKVRSRIYKERIFRGILRSAIFAFWLIAGFSAIEALSHGDPLFRTSIVVLGSTALLLCAGLFILEPVLRWKNVLKSISEKEVAALVGTAFPEIKDRLWNILDIFNEHDAKKSAAPGFHPDYSPELIDASFGDLQKAAAQLSFTDVVSFNQVRKAGRYLAVVAVFTIILFLIPQFDLLPSANRLVHFRTEFSQPAAFTFLVRPGNAEIVRGESVPVAISLIENAEAAGPIRRSMPKKITLSIRQTGISSEDRVDVQSDSAGQFHYILSSLRQSAEYSAEAEGIHSSRYTISVIDRPVVRSLIVHLTPPPYSRLLEQALDDNAGDVTALPGTLIRWHITPNKPLDRGTLIFRDGNEVRLQPRDGAYSGQLILHREGSYHVLLEDSEGFTNADPIEYRLTETPDQAPTVSITYPGKNIDVVDKMELPLRLNIHDDFGFTALNLKYRLVHSRYEKPDTSYTAVSIPLPDGEKQSADAEVGFQWDLSPMGLVPEDVVEYRAEVFDNDNISGPKKGVSETYLLRLPSLDEVFADADKNQNDAIEKLDQSLGEEQDLRKELNEISQEMKKNQPLDWQKQKKAEETLKRYQELTKKIDDVSRLLDTTAQTMQKNNILSNETLQKYSELQQLLQQIDSPEFQQAMKRMQDALQNVSPEQLRQAMQQVQFSEEAFRQSIERTMELLKRIQVEQKMDEMVKRSTEMEKQQESLERETSEDSTSGKQTEELARKQDDIGKQLAEMQKQLEDLRKKMEEFPEDMPMKALEKAEEAARDSALQKAMEQSADQLRRRQQQRAMQEQEKAAKALQEMAQRMSEMQEQMLSNETNEAVNTLRKAMQDMLDISQRQEDLKNQTKGFSPNSEQFRENAEKQLGLQSDLANIANNLVGLSQKSFAVTPEMGKAVGQAMGEMSQAMNGLEQRNGQFSSSAQAEAMTSLNKAATLTQSAMDAIQQGGQGGGAGASLLQQLRRMAGEQQSINAQTEQLSSGKGFSQEQLQEMGRLANQQDAVRKSLEQLNKEARESQDKNRILGDLQRIADDMKEVVENLQQNNVNPNTLRQQQRILSRMLDAQTSMRERDYEQRRTSAAGVTPVRRSPAEIQDQPEQNGLRQDLLKAMEEGYSKDYQDLIRKYYEALDKSRGN